jgi:uncharacterized protein YndB with AHSA1/START domain
MTTPDITGTVTQIDGAAHLVLTRTFTGSADALWAWLIDSPLLEQWIGRWEGDPSTGVVDFFLTSEGADIEAERYSILECERPRRFACDTSQKAGAWHLWFELDEHADTTTLRFGHRVDDGKDVSAIGPGWEYYLDRLAVARDGRDVATVLWDDYYPAQSDAYAALAQ